MGFPIEISIGIKNLKFIKQNACAYDQHCPCNINISYELTGNFLQAALNDDINYTVDYDLLSQYIIKYLQACVILNLHELKKIIKKFSCLIKSGKLELELRCPHVYKRFREKI
jgi:dihydroneopterin aldolase